MPNPIKTAIPTTGVGNRGNLRANLAEAVALPLKDAAAVAEFHLYDLADDGTLYPAVIFDGTVYDYDSADGSTAHDPDAGCITDASGRRYKRATALKPDYIVQDKDLAVPPSSPTQGQSWYVATAATGAWATHDDEIATYGRQGWHFGAVNQGHILYVMDEGAYYHMPSGGALKQGFGALAIADGTIKPALLESSFGLAVEAQQNDPPASIPGSGIAYIVGSVPTGAWAGQGGNVAISDGTAWEFISAYTGAVVTDKSTDSLMRKEASAWVLAQASPIYSKIIPIDVPPTNKSITFNTWETFKTVSIAAPTTSTIFIDLLKFDVEKVVGSNPAEFQLIRDTEVVPILSGLASDFVFITPADAVEHDYHFQIKNPDDSGDLSAQLQVIFRVIDAATDRTTS